MRDHKSVIDKVTLFVWYAMAASVVVYAGAVEFLSGAGNLEYVLKGTQNGEITRYVLIGVAIFSYYMTTVFRKKAEAAVQGQDNPLLAAKLYNYKVITFAFCEAPAVSGLVLFFLTGNKTEFYIFTVMSILMFVINYPRSRF